LFPPYNSICLFHKIIYFVQQDYFLLLFTFIHSLEAVNSFLLGKQIRGRCWDSFACIYVCLYTHMM